MLHIVSGSRFFATLLLTLSSSSLYSGIPLVNASPSDSSVDYDVVVIGGGYSGLVAAYDSHQAGLKTVVLEAKDALGGRSRTVKLESGPGIVELGATWINNVTQPQVYALTQQFGLETIVQYNEGDELAQTADGEVHRTSPDDDVDLEDPNALLEYELVVSIIEASEAIDNENTDDFPKEQDVTFAEWVAQLGLWEYPHIQAFCSVLVSNLVGREPDEVGAHYILDYIHSGTGLVNLTGVDELSAQYLMVKEGTTAIATGLAKALPHGSVLVGTPADSITQRDDCTIVTSSTGQSFKTRKVILAIPTNTYDHIKFSPPLPCKKQAITSNTKPGVYAKMILTYTEAWWRDAGLVGRITSPIGPIGMTWEMSVPELSQYSLATFITGDDAARWSPLSDEEKKSSVVEHLAVLVGEDLADRARDVLEINYAEWTTEEYILGGPTSSMGAGLLRHYGRYFREPFKNVHFAGSELAYDWKGYLEGAVTAGQAAAQQVIQALDA